MVYSIQSLTHALKRAREKKGLSQRAFARRIGVPQSRLSRIENGAVDVRASSLLDIARALDLEVMLVPREYVPVVRGLTRNVDQTRAVAETQRPLYQLDGEDDDA